MRVIVLGAGQGYQLDGFNKLLIRDPRTGDRILDKYLRAFAGMHITVVVGFRAVSVMHRYPALHYVYNEHWASLNNSYSLALALDEQPCYVISADLFIEPDLIAALEGAAPNCAVTAVRENRPTLAVNCTLDSDGRLATVYRGRVVDPSDPETMGIYKMTEPELLSQWKRNCVNSPERFIAENLPLTIGTRVAAFDRGAHRLDEINTPLDYIRAIDESRGAKA